MGTTDDHTTDRHDESNTHQFGDDHTNIDGTPFTNTHCTDCGTHVVAATTYCGQPLCIDCRRHRTGVNWPSGQNIGQWHPTTPITFVGTEHANRRIEELKQHVLLLSGHPKNGTEWRWACIHCRETGTALNPHHATAMHKTHLGYACPAAPGLDLEEIKKRLARRQTHTDLYPETTPQMHLQKQPNGTYKAVTK